MKDERLTQVVLGKRAAHRTPGTQEVFNEHHTR